MNLLEKVHDLHKQSMTDKTHYYTRNVLEEVIAYIERQETEQPNSHNILTVGWHKGEMDFGVNCAIDQLDVKQMHSFRVMTCVAIGQAERMWSDSRKNTVAVSPGFNPPTN